MIPYGRQSITDEDVRAVVEALRSDWITQGPAIPRFEASLQRWSGAGHVLAMNSATSALHVACLALGLGPGDRLWTSPITFVASANCARYCGAEVDFVDVDPRSVNMSAAALEAKLVVAEREGRLPKVVVPVAFAGQSCDMVAIRVLADRYGFAILEDAAHAIGGRYRDAPIGCGRYADITIYSFHPVKIVTTAEGGAALTNDAALAAKMGRLRSHGTTRDPALMQRPPDGPWSYEQLELGYNYRITDLQAALGASQMERLEAHVARRHVLADRYDRLLAGLPLTTPWRDPNGYSAFHLYVIRLEPRLAPARERIFRRLVDAGIGVNVHYIPVHLQPYYRALGGHPGQCPEAEAYYAGAITLPLFPTLGEADQDRVVAAVKAAIAAEPA